MNFRFARKPDYEGSVDGTDQLPDGRPLGNYFRTRLSIGRLEVQSGNQNLVTTFFRLVPVFVTAEFTIRGFVEWWLAGWRWAW